MVNKNISIDDIKQTIRKVLVELVELDESEMKDDKLFIEEMGVNSITIVQVFLSCQDKYDVVLADEMNLAEPLSIRTLAEKVYKKLGEYNEKG
ncbi:MAG: hypothetical protein IJA10_15050 [Lachnospiraceae bacterium]|nr:hypothetical protein [Lachnospiraceae bacterium]